MTAAPSHRSTSAQQLPSADLNGFPARSGLTGTTAYREHALRPDSPDGGCWYFDSHAPDGPVEGRFSLTSPKGTCYMAQTEQAAARERCGRLLAASMPIPFGFVAEREISAVQVPETAAPIADMLDDEATNRFGVTGELFTNGDYSLTGAWADVLSDTGFGSLLYQPRFTTSPTYALALFDAEGPQPDRAVLSSQPVTAVLAGMGVRVSQVPTSGEASTNDEVDCEEA